MLYHERLGYDCEWRCHACPKLDRGIPSGHRSLRWCRDEASGHFHRVILYRSVRPCFLTIVAEDDHNLGLGGLTILQLTTTYAPVVAGRNIGYVLFKKNQHYAWSEHFRLIQIFRVRNRCCWARWCIPLVGTPESRRAGSHGVVVGKSSPARCFPSLTIMYDEGSSTHDTSRVLFPTSMAILHSRQRRRG